MQIVLKIVLSIVVLFLLIAATFISQLYNPVILWIVAFSVIPLSVTVKFFIKSNLQFDIVMLIFSMVINAGLILKVPFGNPILEIALYAVGFLIGIWGLLVLLSQLIFSAVQESNLLLNNKSLK